jgi:hypothetical protein
LDGELARRLCAVGNAARSGRLGYSKVVGLAVASLEAGVFIGLARSRSVVQHEAKLNWSLHSHLQSTSFARRCVFSKMDLQRHSEGEKSNSGRCPLLVSVTYISELTAGIFSVRSIIERYKKSEFLL